MFFKYTNENKYKNRFNNIIYTIIEDINETDYNLSYCTGLAGIAFGLNFFREEEMLEKFDIDSGLTVIDNILFEWIYKSSKSVDDFDFLHGTLGALYYLLTRSHPKVDELILKFCYIINEYIDKGVSSYESEVINFGISHGNISYIQLLSIYLVKKNNIIVLNTLKRIIHLQYKYVSKNPYSLALFPSISYFNSNQSINYNIQMGWCYGDQSAFVGIYNSAILLKSSKYEGKAKIIANHCARRETVEKAFFSDLTDACFCHGTSGAAYLFKKMHLIYKENIFLKLYESYIKYTLERRKFFEISKSGYVKYSNISQTYISSNGILDGITGIGIVLIDYLMFLSDNKMKINWDEIFLIQTINNEKPI